MTSFFFFAPEYRSQQRPAPVGKTAPFGWIVALSILIAAPAHGADTLAVIFTGNASGAIEDCGCDGDVAGGFGRAATVLKRLRQLHPGAVFVETGDFLSTYAGAEHNSDVIAALSRLEPDAVVPGSFEFIGGTEFFVREGARRMPVLLSNSTRPEFHAAMTFTRDSGGILLLGILAAEEFQARGAEPPTKLLPWRNGLQRSLIRHAKNQLTTVAVAHGPSGTAEACAGLLPKGSLVLRGHWHAEFEPRRDAVRHVNGRTIATVGAGGGYVGIATKTASQTAWEVEIIPLKRSIPVTPGIENTDARGVDPPAEVWRDTGRNRK